MYQDDCREMASSGIVGTTLKGFGNNRYNNIKYYDANCIFAGAVDYSLGATTIKRLAKREKVKLEEVQNEIGF